MSGIHRLITRAIAVAGLGLIWLAGSAVAGVDTWDLTALEGGSINSLTIDPDNSDRVFAGTSTGLFESGDGGMTWEKTTGHHVSDLEIGSDGTLYFAESGVWRSEDDGETWQELINELRDSDGEWYLWLNDLVLVPGTPDVLYAATWEGLYRSTDRAATWDYLSELTRDIMAIVVDPEEPNTLIAGTSEYSPGTTGYGIFRSLDEGASWTRVYSESPWNDITCFAIAPNASEENSVWAGTRSGLLRSDDTGATWTPAGLEGKQIETLLWNSGTLYAGTNRGSGAETLFSSSDSGDSWTVLNGVDFDLPDQSVRALVFSDHLYAGLSAMGVYQQDLEGWEPTNDGLYALQVNSMVFTPFDPLVFLGTESGVWVYDRTEQTVAPLREGMSHIPINSLAYGDFGDGSGVLYASSPVVGIYKRSLPIGSEPVWSTANSSGELPQHISDLAVDESSPNDLFAAVGGEGLYRSANGGESWQQVEFDFRGGVNQVALGTDPMVVYAGTGEGRIYRTIDGGQRWSERSSNWWGGINEILVDPDDPDIVYVGADDTIFRSDDGGRSWHRFDHRGELQWGGIGPAMVLDPTNPREIYVRQHGEVFQSFNRGDWFKQISRPEGNGWSWISALAFAPGSNFIFASSPGWIGEIELSDSSPVITNWWHHRGAVFPNEPVNIFARVSPGDAAFASIHADIYGDREASPIATIPLLDGGVPPDEQAVDSEFSVQWSGAATPGHYSIDLVAEDVNALQTELQNIMGFQIAHTILSIPNRMLISPEQLTASKVPVLIEDDGQGYLTSQEFLSTQFEVHIWSNDNSLDPVAVGIDTSETVLGGLPGVMETGSNSWYDYGRRWNVNAALANGDLLSLFDGGSSAQAVFAYIDLEVEAPDNNSIGLNLQQVMFDEDQEGAARICCSNLELGRGDVDMDGTIVSFDASLVLMHAVRKLDLNWGDNSLNDWAEDLYGFTFPHYTQHMADVTGQMGITALDAALILQRATDIITYFPTEEDYYRLWDPPAMWWNPPTLVPKLVANALPRLQRTVSLGTLEERADGVLAVPVLIDELEGVLAGSFALTYDPAQLQPVGVRSAELTRNYLFADHATDDRVRVGFAGVEWQQGSGALAEVLFRYRDVDSKEVGELLLSEVQLNEGNVETQVMSSPTLTASSLPQTFALYPNYPNPFNPNTTIRYDLPGEGVVRLSVYNLSGQKIRTLLDGHQIPGVHRVAWDGKDETGMQVASGIYLYRLKTGTGVLVRKMLMLK